MSQDHEVPFDTGYSALGTNPTCDVCGKYIQLGERVKQTFTGEVKTTSATSPGGGELVVEESSYRLVHEKCEPIN